MQLIIRPYHIPASHFSQDRPSVPTRPWLRRTRHTHTHCRAACNAWLPTADLHGQWLALLGMRELCDGGGWHKMVPGKRCVLEVMFAGGGGRRAGRWVAGFALL